MKRLTERIMIMSATGFGLGYSPVAPGTVGSLWGVLLVLVLHPHLDWIGQVLLAACLSLLAVPLCDVAERHFGRKDPHCIVADEYLTFSISLIGLPIAWTTWWILPLAFATNRFFDIVKLPPAYRLQNLPGGWGIVADDVFAALYSLAVNHLAWLAYSRWWGG